MSESEGAEAGEGVDTDRYYKGAVVKLAQSLIVSISTSQACQNLPGGDSSKKYWASVLFARLCGIGGSLQRILPGSASNRAGEVWDGTSALSLCRTMFEAHLALYYLCFDPMTDDDYSLRLRLMFLHDSIERPRIMSKISGQSDPLSEAHYKAQGDRLRGLISQSPVFQALPESKRKRLLEGRTPYYLSQDDLLERQGSDAGKTRGIWEFMSSHVHSYPFSFSRTTEVADRGTGRENRVDKAYSGLAAEMGSAMLTSASEKMAALFPEVASIPRCLIDWDTLTCRAVRREQAFAVGMMNPAVLDRERSPYARAAAAIELGKLKTGYLLLRDEFGSPRSRVWSAPTPEPLRHQGRQSIGGTVFQLPHKAPSS